MCDPVSALIGVSTAINVAGSVTKGLAAKQTADTNAAALEQQIAQREEKAKYDVELADRKYRRQAGAVRAAIGSTNLDISSFSDVLADDAAESALEKAAIKSGALVDEKNLYFQAQGQRQAGQNAQTGMYFNVAGDFANGFTRRENIRYQRAKGGVSIDPDGFGN